MVDMRIVPGILTAQENELRLQLKTVRAMTNYLQLDVIDGVWLPKKTISLEQIQTAAFSGLTVEAHLMVAKPADYFNICNHLGIKKVIFHIEAPGTSMAVVREARNYNLMVGLALNPETPIDALLNYLDETSGEINSVLVMTVNPGRQGNPFIASGLKKVKELRRKYSGLEIGADGGINLENILSVSQAGFDYAVVGSALFGQSDAVEVYRQLVVAAS